MAFTPLICCGNVQGLSRVWFSHAAAVVFALQVAASVAEAAAAKELSWPTAEQLGHRDATGCYSAAAPFWAKVSDARY